MYLAPRWALSAQAIDAASDPRLARGVHLRAMPSGRIGLPLTPLVVYRVVVAQPDDRLYRTDVRWFDSHGVALTPSFSVTPDNPVTAWLPPPPAACCWLEVLAKPNGPGLQVDAAVSTRRGPAIVATRRAERYVVAASHIEHVVVRGSGTVTGVRWIEASSILPSGPWRQWSLPVTSGPRYVTATGADADAKARVLAGAPSRRGLYEDPRSGSAATAPPVTPTDEWTRVEPLTSDLRAWLQRLTHDTSASPDMLTQAFTVNTGATIGNGALPILPSTLQAALDPGLGRWVGLADVDVAPPASGIVFYLISGVWQLWPHLVPSLLFGQLPPGAVFDGRASDPAKRLPLVNVRDRLDVQGPCAELWAVAAASIGVPCDPPAIPDVVIGDGPWMPSPPASPIRQVPIDASSMTAAALLAFARDDGGVVSLNPVSPSTGKPLPLFASPPRTSRAASAAHVEDRNAPPGAPKYRIAQADWFGRWSDWRFAAAAIKPRTAPPRPTLEVFYAPAPVTAVGLARGRLTVRAAIPDDGALPPGCEPLQSLTLSLRGDGGFAADLSFAVAGGPGAHVIRATHPVPPATTPAPTPAILEAVADGPALDVGGVLTVAITARWTTASRTSAPSDAMRRDLGDTRPIPPPPIPSTLRYTARPDARGRAHFELDLPAAGGAHYRVFYADENQLRRGLAKLAAGGYTVDGTPEHIAAVRARAAIAAADLATAGALGAADRAARFVAYADVMTYDMFQNLTPTALAPSTFAHDLSGSLTALSFYRAVTFNASGVPSDFTGAPIVPVAVRSEPPPARPMISVTGAATRARITVRVPRTQVDPVQYRVRRSSVATTPDPRQMMVIHESALPGERDEGRELVVFDHIDDGPLKPWRRYAWAVEVRAGAPVGAPPGSTLLGDYGPPSVPATLAVVPAGPPDAITTLAAMRNADGVHLSWTAPDPRSLIATDMGAHRFDLYRVLPGQHPRRLALPSPPVLDSDGVFRFVDTGAPATAVSYRIVVVDPLGRGSRPSATVSLP